MPFCSSNGFLKSFAASDWTRNVKTILVMLPRDLRLRCVCLLYARLSCVQPIDLRRFDNAVVMDY